MTKHTLGPWRVGDAGLTVFGPPNGNPSPATVAHVKTRSDARLIAAAPELLAAARLVVERWEHGDLAGAVRMLDAAIAKAETR